MPRLHDRVTLWLPVYGSRSSSTPSLGGSFAVVEGLHAFDVSVCFLILASHSTTHQGSNHVLAASSFVLVAPWHRQPLSTVMRLLSVTCCTYPFELSTVQAWAA
jgi:hypothetical protein